MLSEKIRNIKFKEDNLVEFGTQSSFLPSREQMKMAQSASDEIYKTPIELTRQTLNLFRTFEIDKCYNEIINILLRNEMWTKIFDASGASSIPNRGWINNQNTPQCFPKKGILSSCLVLTWENNDKEQEINNKVHFAKNCILTFIESEVGINIAGEAYLEKSFINIIGHSDFLVPGENGLINQDNKPVSFMVTGNGKLYVNNYPNPIMESTGEDIAEKCETIMARTIYKMGKLQAGGRADFGLNLKAMGL